MKLISSKTIILTLLLAVGICGRSAYAEMVDLAHNNTGTITGVPGGPARFDFATTQPTGTGVIQSFLRVQNSPAEQGYNTSGGTPFDDKPGIFTHNIQVSDLQATAIDIAGVIYYRLLL